MKFNKYNSIENHYDKKNINYWVSLYPELYKEQYVIQEKIHGSNFSIWFENTDIGVDIKCAKRTSFLDITEGFFNYQLVLKDEKIDKLIEEFTNKIKKTDIKELVVFGELYGNGIQKGVFYSDKKEIRFFDMRINGNYIPFRETEEFFKEFGLEELLVPKLAVVNSLDEALEFNTEFNSLIPDRKFENLENICEGVVIKSYNKVFTNNDGSFFYLKKKNEKFLENSKEKKPSQKDYTMSDKANELKDIFQTFVTENRLYNVFSKYGKIESMKDIGKYISLLIEDAKQDFFKEFLDDFIYLTDREKRNVLKASDIASKLVRNSL